LDAAFFHLYLPADENGDWRPARKADGWGDHADKLRDAIDSAWIPSPRVPSQETEKGAP
jgi:hypothetical protein